MEIINIGRVAEFATRLTDDQLKEFEALMGGDVPPTDLQAALAAVRALRRLVVEMQPAKRGRPRKKVEVKA